MVAEKSYTALIILNYNNWEDTVNCIRSVESYNTSPIKYVIVDNASNRENAIDALRSSLEVLSNKSLLELTGESLYDKPLPKFTFVANRNNGGYAAGNNSGLKFVYPDSSISYILILNNDILFVEDIIPKLISRYNSINDCGIISPVLFKKNMIGLDHNCARRSITPVEMIKRNFLTYIYALFHKKVNKSRYLLDESMVGRDSVLPIDLPSGACMLVSKYLFEFIESFDPNTFLYYEEDILYSKIKSIGKQNYLDLSSKCIHLGAVSTKKSPSLLIMKTDCASARYYMKHYSGCSTFLYYLFCISQKFYMFIFTLQKKSKIRLSRS